MPLKPSIVNMIRKSSLRAFRALSKGKGVFEAKIYPAVSGTTENIERNIYHDVIRDDTLIAQPIETYCFIELNAPLKVVKEMGWWKENESLPIIAYLPFQDNFKPEKYTKIVIESQEGYMSDTWEINHVKMYGQDTPVLWVCTVSAERN